MQEVEDLLDESIATEGYIIPAPVGQDLESAGLVNLSELDLEVLTKRFESSTHKRTEIERLTGLIERRLKHLIKLNHSRMNYLEQFQEMIDEYNSGSRNIEAFFAQIKEFARSLTEEEQRHVAQGLSEEELAIFDILTRPEPTLTKRDEAVVKKVAKTLLQTLKWEKLVLDWRLKQQACAEVQETIAEIFDTLPEIYSKELFDAKRELAYRHIYAAYAGAGESIYERAA
jgi:type I restriction enzyme, R subunit